MKSVLENFSTALNDLNKAIELKPDEASYYKLRANVKYQLEDDEGACQDWNKAKSMGDKSVDYYIKQYCK